MKIFTASLAAGFSLLVGALPAAALPSAAPRTGIPVTLAADDDTAADRQDFTRKAEDQMHDWQRKVEEFNTQAEAKGAEAGKRAKRDLDKALIEAQRASKKLAAAGAEGWHGAKASFEKASRSLADTWNRNKPQ